MNGLPAGDGSHLDSASCGGSSAARRRSNEPSDRYSNSDRLFSESRSSNVGRHYTSAAVGRQYVVSRKAAQLLDAKLNIGNVVCDLAMIQV